MKRKLKEKQEKGTKKTILQWCEERPSLWKSLKMIWFDALLIPCFMIAAYFFAMYCIGNGAYNYSDEAYNELKTAIESNITEDFGMDEKSLRESVDEFELYYKDGKSIIVCRNVIGHFVAEVKAELSEDKLEKVELEENDLSEEDTNRTYYSAPTIRNYNSRGDYLKDHYLEVATWLFGGFCVWFFGVKCLFNLLLFVFAKGFIKISEIRNSKSQV